MINEHVIVVRSPSLTDQSLNALFCASWPAWSARTFQPVLQQSLDYLGAFCDDSLVGFVNVAWDGGLHGFILDTTVHPNFRRRGIASHMLREAKCIAAEHKLQWLHVDFDATCQSLYRESGFDATLAGLYRVGVDA